MLVAILVISIINLLGIVALLNHMDELEEKRQFDADFTLGHLQYLFAHLGIMDDFVKAVKPSEPWRPKEEKISDMVRADPSSGREIHFRNTSDEVVDFDNFMYGMRANPDYAKVFEDEQRSHNEEIVDSVRGEAHSVCEVCLNNEAFDSDQEIKVVPGKRHCLIVYVDVDGLFRSKLIEFDFFTHDGLNVQFFCDGDLVDSCGYMKLESILFC